MQGKKIDFFFKMTNFNNCNELTHKSFLKNLKKSFKNDREPDKQVLVKGL